MQGGNTDRRPIGKEVLPVSLTDFVSINKKWIILLAKEVPEISLQFIQIFPFSISILYLVF